jgi:hypothetical protein
LASFIVRGARQKAGTLGGSAGGTESADYLPQNCGFLYGTAGFAKCFRACPKASVLTILGVHRKRELVKIRSVSAALDPDRQSVRRTLRRNQLRLSSSSYSHAYTPPLRSAISRRNSALIKSFPPLAMNLLRTSLNHLPRDNSSLPAAGQLYALGPSPNRPVTMRRDVVGHKKFAAAIRD